jgi:ankyrin repeat protein
VEVSAIVDELAARNHGVIYELFAQKFREGAESKVELIGPALQLISEGADPDGVDEDGRSSLLHTSAYGALDGVAARLIAAGAKLDLVSAEGASALMFACLYMSTSTAVLLIVAGAALNLVETQGRTALDYADNQGLVSIASALRARGGLTGDEITAAKRDKARAKLSAKAMAKAGERLFIACLGLYRADATEKTDKQYAATALRLIDEGADLDVSLEAFQLFGPGGAGGTPLMVIAGGTPLMVAASHSALSTVAARLIAAGAKLDRVNKTGGSALFFACDNEQPATALLLVKAGAALNLVHSSGRTALDEASENGLASLAEAIRARGGLTGAELKLARRA